LTTEADAVGATHIVTAVVGAGSDQVTAAAAAAAVAAPARLTKRTFKYMHGVAAGKWIVAADCTVFFSFFQNLHF
jgi:hypothetical protein